MAKIYQFGKFLLNIQEQLLTADGRPVHLPTKEFETLQMLVENNGKVLSKDEMMTAIWKDTFVEESNLAQYVSRLRKILNVDGNQYIKTVSKRGYRFSAEVKISHGDLVIERHLRLKVGGKESRGLGEINSVAVLPFKSLASPVEDEFLGLGLTDALITQLTRTGTIITRPTASVLKYRSGEHDSVAIAELLNVDAILEGNFQKSGNRLRLTVQMLDSETGKTLWAESFNTEIEDIFDVQDRIAGLVVNALSKQYSAETQGQLNKRYTENKTAYEEYLRGRVNFSKRTAESLTAALQSFEAAIRIDPKYALAYAGMAEAYQLLPLSDALEPQLAIPKAKAAALRALEIDDAIPEAHVSLGGILMDFDWNWPGAELSFRKALELNPNNAAAHQALGTLMLRLGRIGDAILELKKAQLLDPVSPAINTWMGEAFAQLGEHDAAIRIHKETLRFAPDYLFAHYFLVQSYVSTGELSQATTAAESAVAHSDDMSLARSASIFLKAQIGDLDGARTELNELIRQRDEKYVSAVNVASGFAVLNETDETFRWLEIALLERDSNLTWLNIDREFSFLRADPRFREIVRRVGLPYSPAAPGSVGSGNGMPAAVVDHLDGAGDLVSKRRWPAVAIAGAIALLILGSAYYLAPFFKRGGPPDKNALIQLTDGPFDYAYPTFTHEGQVRFARFVDKQTLVTYVMNADGTGMSEQTKISGLTSGLYSPDGSKVLFRRGPGDPNVYLASSDGSDERIVPFRPGNCSWSPDSRQLVYQSKGTDTTVANNSDIFIYSLETGAVAPIVESPFFDADPTFSPDGTSIVYASDVQGNFEIYSKVTSSGETKRLTNSAGHDSFPTYSPDGTQIIFSSDREKENTDVYLMNADGTNVRKITDGPGWDAAPPNSWSRDGTQVLLLSDMGGNEHVYLMNIEPFAPRNIAPGIESDQPLDTAYSPDGNKVVYISEDDIRMLEISSQIERVVLSIAAAGQPSFSPDGRRILFQGRIDENTEICSVNVDGSGFANLTQSPSRDMSPSYSPDGTRIVFAANRAAGTSTFEIYVMNADGSDQRMVYGDRSMSAGVAWSPDGQSLVFANDLPDGRSGNFEIFSVNLDGSALKRLTYRRRYDVDPWYSPDGSRIAFASNTDGNSEIYVMNADGGSVLRLTRDLGEDISPSWSPDGRKLIFTSNRSGKYAIYEIEL